MAEPPGGWADAFTSELRRGGTGSGSGDEAFDHRQLFLSYLPPGYPEETGPEDAANDWRAVHALTTAPVESGPSPGSGGSAPSGPLPVPQVGSLVLSPCRGSAPGDFRLRRTGRGRVELSSLLPVLESFGLAAVEAVPWHFVLGPGGPEAYLDDIGLRVVTAVVGAGVGSPRFDQRLVEAIGAVLGGRAEVNVLNRLVVGAELSWREVSLLCAYGGYRAVVGGHRGAERAQSIGDALVAFPAVAAATVGLFRARLVPAPAALEAPDQDAAEAGVVAALTEVPDLAHYEDLRELVSLVRATTRTNWALGSGAVALKFASPAVPFLPAPKPMAEIFVWSPSFEALHLRFGPVARGGIRWSDRQSDMRAEVLGLARAQVKKNTLIIPTGAKGAFTLRGGPAAHDKALAQKAYSEFMDALLDVTDNIVGGQTVHPPGVICRDGDDPYLVVAPDKGTAAFSDVANKVSTGRSFWLGDAFASGGSRGYDHKALGITARGAWLAVRRHFRALGMDPQVDQLRVVGVGDMSGDVFGNGMLQSRALLLVAAFDHRHIFIDPTPGPEQSFAERLRLSRLPGSTWADFDMTAASPGAAVFSRQAKEAVLSAEAAAALGIPVGPLTPPELVKACLRAPVDLIFFGGVGTFVKAPGESDVEVDDEDNDEVRVSADQLRARVVAEGANLALTQRARASYSRRGGRVNADFVDNAAGVAMSDREVNLKILLGVAISAGRLAAEARDEALFAAQDEAAAAVLATVEGSLVALDQAARSSPDALPAYEALMVALEHSGLLDREVEALPGPEELARRRDAGAGLSRPELAVVVSFARAALARSIEGSELTASPALAVAPCAISPPLYVNSSGTWSPSIPWPPRSWPQNWPMRSSSAWGRCGPTNWRPRPGANCGRWPAPIGPRPRCWGPVARPPRSG